MLLHQARAKWSEILELDLTANWRLIRAMDLLLRMAPAGRAIFVTSRLAWPRAALLRGLRGGQGRSGDNGAPLCRRGCPDIHTRQPDRSPQPSAPGCVLRSFRARTRPGSRPESITGAFVELASPECTRNGDIVADRRRLMRPRDPRRSRRARRDCAVRCGARSGCRSCRRV